jgi:hypothetical protein
MMPGHFREVPKAEARCLELGAWINDTEATHPGNRATRFTNY